MPRRREPILAQVLSVTQMREAEAALIAKGTSVEALMDLAGRGAGEWVRRIAATRAVTVLCGPGNNGGDGWVIARHLHEHGTPVVAVAARDPATAAAKDARALYTGPVANPDAAPQGEVLVDCLFGSGLTRPLPDDLLALLKRHTAAHHHVIAIDLPSGIDSDSGAALNEDLPRATHTVALGAWKFAHWTHPAAAAMGTRHLVDIGVAAVPRAARLLGKPAIAPPASDDHKYSRGLAAIVAGAMPGAPLLSADAALRSGAGYVKLIAETRPPGVPHDLVCEVVGDGDALRTSLADERIAALLLGPGLGRDLAAKERLAAVLARALPTVLDADALQLLTPVMLGGRSAPLLLTPHMGEFAALERAFDLPGEGPRRTRAAALAQATQAVVLLKGADSLIAAPDGALVLGQGASSWLSVAGSGDVLAGIAVSRLAVTADPLAAAQQALWLHSEAARHAGVAFTSGEVAHAVRAALATALPR